MNLIRLQQSERAFTLIELMVTIAIVTLVTALALVRYGSFNNAILLKSQAFEIALDIRQTQQYAISSSAYFDPTNSRQGMGMYFSMSTPGKYLLYQDGNGNYRYDSGEEIGTPYPIDPRFQIDELCVNGVCGGVSDVSVGFRRPNFDARLYDGTTPVTSNVSIVLRTVTNSTTDRRVTVYPSGQISVQ